MPLSPRCARDEAQELAAAVAARAHGEAQVRPVEAVDEQLRRRREQPRDDVAARRLVGGRGEGDGLGDAERVAQRREVHVVGTEVVAPLRDAVRLVDREHRGLRGAEHRHHLGLGEPLRRDIGEPQFAPRDLLGDVAVLGKIVGGIERGSGDAVALELRHLVAHQRDQRRDHDGEPVAQQRRKLIAQRLAAAGRHDREHVAAGEDRRDDLRLPVAERRRSRTRCAAVCGRRRGRSSPAVLSPTLAPRLLTGGCHRPARPGDPVTTGLIDGTVSTHRQRGVAGCPAYAGHDSEIRSVHRISSKALHRKLMGSMSTSSLTPVAAFGAPLSQSRM